MRKFCFTTRINTNEINDYYHFSIQVEASKGGYENKIIIEEFKFQVALYAFSIFTIDDHTPRDIKFGYEQQTWTPTMSPPINPSPDWIAWSLGVNSCSSDYNDSGDFTNDLANKLSINTTTGTITLQPGLENTRDPRYPLLCSYYITVTVRKANYTNKIVSTNVSFDIWP